MGIGEEFHGEGRSGRGKGTLANEIGNSVLEVKEYSPSFSPYSTLLPQLSLSLRYAPLPSLLSSLAPPSTTYLMKGYSSESLRSAGCLGAVK